MSKALEREMMIEYAMKVAAEHAAELVKFMKGELDENPSSMERLRELAEKHYDNY